MSRSRLQVELPLRDEMAGFKFSVVLGDDGNVTAYRGQGEKLVDPIHVYVTVPGDFVL